MFTLEIGENLLAAIILVTIIFGTLAFWKIK